MTRLIDADAFKKQLEESYEYTELSEVIEMLDNASTVDITEEQAIDKLHETGWLPRHDKEMTERPQGEWIRKVDEAGFISHICSECGAEIEVEDPKDDKFCFNCGAKMKGGADNV